MKRMRHNFLGTLALLAVVALWAAPVAGEDAQQDWGAVSDGVKVATLVHEFQQMDSDQLEALMPIDVERFTLPDSSVHVMRAVIEETYTVDGVGRDTVELSGWIAVKHGNARPVEGATELAWHTAVLDTEFVGMHLSGESDIFGRVEVRLDPANPPRGKVGQIELPEAARAILARIQNEQDTGIRLASLAPEEFLDDDEAEEDRGDGPADRGGADSALPKFERLDGTRMLRDVPEGLAGINRLDPDAQRQIEADLNEVTGEFFIPIACAAPLDPNINFSDLDLHVRPEEPTQWYSLVDTIPPVGQTASATIKPVRLISLTNGREVGTLEEGIVKFREIVRRVHLNDEPPVLTHDPDLKVATVSPESEPGE